MPFEFLLPLLTYPTATPEEGLSGAVGFAATLGGRLAVSAHIADIPPVTNPLAGAFYDYATVAAAVEAGSKKKASELTQTVKRLAAQLQLPVVAKTFRARPELAAENLAETARSHDVTLLVLDKESNTHRDVAEVLLFGSGGPVILFPGSGQWTQLETVAIAWDGGRAAARAVRDALPLLRLARQAVILTATDDKAVAPASVEAISDFLGTHGIETVHRNVPSDGRLAGDVLQGAALAQDASLLVMGAYGHNRVREFVLGGATRSVLADIKLPILMSH